MRTALHCIVAFAMGFVLYADRPAQSHEGRQEVPAFDLELNDSQPLDGLQGNGASFNTGAQDVNPPVHRPDSYTDRCGPRKTLPPPAIFGVVFEQIGGQP